MGNFTGQGIEAIAVRRAVIADADKVRYRVYRTADDYIAVIAESALMAVKVSGITEPVRIVRDLPSEQISLEADRMAKIDVPQRVALGLEQKSRKHENIEFPQAAGIDFIPMQLRDFERSSRQRARILSPEEMSKLMQRAPALPVAPPPESIPAPAPMMQATPEPEPQPEMIEITPEPVAAAPVEQAPAEVVEPDVLSPEEVARLLGES